ncbi:dUTP diphosphatase [Apibacter adventoris]|uniref:Deoxyuridine 5'-triphosphate nucleotidohydrolase n=1 Tax=Apibacter adventoris TaxID=1679466 RepID=A0A2S8AG65_9FLAO|nr:dUTP diphosphatase [Apibacter adventoris]PQL95375.1 dUTP diphosphatase [Apibacter adventoris]
MKIKIINKSKHELPEYKTAFSAGMDLRANLDKSILLKPLERKIIPTGLYLEIPPGYEGQIRPRSGMAFNHGISCPNSPGTIDADYRGELGVILINLSKEDFAINDGDRIAQLIIAKHETITWEEVERLNSSERGDKGYGSSGIK